jgi:hypothetical protein
MVVRYSTRARVAAVSPFQAGAWGVDLVDYINQRFAAQGVNVTMFSRIGGHQDLLWVAEFPDLDTLQVALATVNSDQGYRTRLQNAVNDHLFEPSSIENAIWISAGDRPGSNAGYGEPGYGEPGYEGYGEP